MLVKARVTKRDDRISLIANDLVVPDLAGKRPRWHWAGEYRAAGDGESRPCSVPAA